MFDFTGKSALLLGGAGYLGTPLAAGLAEQGAQVLIADFKEESLAPAVEAVKRRARPGARTETMRADASDAGSLRECAAQAVARFGKRRSAGSARRRKWPAPWSSC